MITIFRKEMKKWHSVLWVVFASMAVSGVSFVFWRGGEETKVATVNGATITAADLRKSMQQIQRQFSMISAMYGMPLETLLKTFMGGQDIQTLAFDNAVKAALSRQIEKDLNIRIGEDFFREQLLKGLPKDFSDAQGRVNKELYDNYLQRLSLTPAEFEQQREDDFKKEAVDLVVGAAAYTPQFLANFEAAQKSARKSFAIVKFDQDHFKGRASSLEESEVKKFYDDHKDKYKVAEKKQVEFIKLSPQEYEKSVSVDEQAVVAFYEKNKSSRYRVAPKIRVRRLLISGADEEAKKKAEALHSEIKNDVSQFAALAKKHSQDKESASQGGLTEYFGRGTFDAAFEREAFKLMNKHDLAPVVKTNEGFEIVMLEERVNAKEKSLSEVREEIEGLLRTRKATNQLKSDLEKVLHESKAEGADAFAAFMQKLDRKAKLSGMLAAEEEDGFGGKLVERLFGKTNTKKTGYFLDGEDYVLYKVVAHEKSKARPFEEVEADVRRDLLQQKASDDLKHFVKEAKVALLAGKKDLESYKHDGFAFHETAALKDGESIDAFKGVTGLDRAFALDEKGQIQEVRAKGDIYLIQLVKIEENKETDARGTSHKNLQEGRALAHGFIASLQRSAKISVDETLMNGYKS